MPSSLSPHRGSGRTFVIELTQSNDMASTSDIKNGLCITHNHAPYQIIEFLHVKPGKGAAFVRTKMRNLNDGRVLEHTFPSGAKLDDIRIEGTTQTSI